MNIPVCFMPKHKHQLKNCLKAIWWRVLLSNSALERFQLVSSVVPGVTGGLAAPLVAAGAGAVLGAGGAAALGSVAGIAIMASLFGAAGAGLAGNNTE